jgi:hypothetical protein
VDSGFAPEVIKTTMGRGPPLPIPTFEEVNPMFWECSECEGRVEKTRAPLVCPWCGRAGVIFVPAELGIEADPSSATLAEAWLRAGLEAADAAVGFN